MELHHGPVVARKFGNAFGRVAGNVASEFHIIVLNPISKSALHPGRWQLTANSPISASSMPRISASSLARRPRPGIRFMMNRIMQVPPKEYEKPLAESASW